VTNLPGPAPPQLKQDFGQLSGLTGASLTGHNDHLMLGNGGRDLIPARTNWQIRRVGEVW
jgi:hypothetical protein